MQLKCPVCKKPVQAAGAASAGTGAGTGTAAKLPDDFPFCSKRCRMVDLGLWFDGHYRIPGAPVELADDGIVPPELRGAAGEAVDGT